MNALVMCALQLGFLYSRIVKEEKEFFMFMASIFIVLLLAVLSIWLGKRSLSIYIFAISFVIAIVTFFHHITDVIGLSL